MPLPRPSAFGLTSSSVHEENEKINVVNRKNVNNAFFIIIGFYSLEFLNFILNFIPHATSKSISFRFYFFVCARGYG